MGTVFDGTWENQHGSILELKVRGEAVTGRFESGVGDDGHVLWVDVVGRILDDLITFSASYQPYRTLVTWAGQHTEENGVEQIKAHWLHVTNIPDSQEKEWMWFSNRIGSDLFTRA